MEKEMDKCQILLREINLVKIQSDKEVGMYE